MKRKNSSNFLIGVIIGALVGAIIWYWQKSTSAEDGALALLDRLAAAERKLRELSMDLSGRSLGRAVVPEPTPRAADDLQQVRGIGPVFAERLQRAGAVRVRSFPARHAVQGIVAEPR